MTGWTLYWIGTQRISSTTDKNKIITSSRRGNAKKVSPKQILTLTRKQNSRKSTIFDNNH
jgi:hypothetical protein